MVIGVVAAVVATAGALAPVAVGAALGSIGLSIATVSAIATVASIAGGILTAVSKPPGGLVNGSQTQWKADPQAGIPLAFGRTFYAGNIVKRESFGADNIWQQFTTVYSMGPVQSLDQFTADQVAVNFDGGGNAIGGMSTWMYLWTQIGLDPTPAAMGKVAGSSFTANHLLSGLAASNWALRFDKKDGKVYAAGVPQPGMILHGMMCYDPRKDSTYPGGVGTHRWDDQSTWEWSERPALAALSWAIGYKHAGKRRAGIGFHINSIDVAEYVAWANICDANDWKLGGVVSTRDDKWNVLKAMCQAGGAEPLQLGGRLSVTYSAPRVSIATITSADISGTATAAATQPQRERINKVIPRIRSEAHGWEVIDLSPVSDAGYVAQDGGERTEEMDLHMVQDVNQGTELAAYKIANARELSPIDLPLDVKWVGLRPGLAVTLEIPELNLNGQKALAISHGFIPANGSVSVQLKTETDAKHDFALGRVGTAPPTPELTGPTIDYSAPLVTDWSVEGVSLDNGASGSQPAIHLLGGVTRSAVESIIIEYRLTGEVEWQQWGQISSTATVIDVTGLMPGDSYDVAVRYLVRGFLTDRTIYTPIATPAIVSAPQSWEDILDPLGTKPEDNATVGATPAQVADITSALTLAAKRGKLFFRTLPPSVAESTVGDTWIADDGVFYDRVNEGGILLGGFAITLGGFRPIMPWTPSVLQPLKGVIATANTAYANANDAIDQLIGLADDGIISINEKVTKLIPESARLASKWSILSVTATNLGVGIAAASAARTAWLNFLAAISPAWNDTNSDSPVSRSGFDAARDNYDAALYDLDQSIKDHIKGLADTAQVTAVDAANDAGSAQIAADAAQADADAAQALAASGLNPDGTVKASKVVASSLDGSVVHEITAAAVANVVASDAGAVLVSVANVTAKPSQGGRVLILVTSDVTGTTNGGLDSIQGYAVLYRSPAGAGVWTKVGSSWRMLRFTNFNVFTGYAGEVADGSGGFNIPVTGGFANMGNKTAAKSNGMTISVAAANQWIDTPPADGDYDYRVLFSKTDTPGTVTAASVGAATAASAEMQAVSIKVAQ